MSIFNLNPYKSSSTRCLLEISLVKLNSYEIALRQVKGGRIHMPKYCINDIYHNILDADCHFQFFDVESNFDENEEPKYFLFDIESASPLLDEEIGNSGLEDIIKMMDEAGNIKFYEILDNLSPMNHEMSTSFIQTTRYIVIDLEYNTDCSGPDFIPESEISFELIGYLNSDMELININKEYLELKHDFEEKFPTKYYYNMWLKKNSFEDLLFLFQCGENYMEKLKHIIKTKKYD